MKFTAIKKVVMTLVWLTQRQKHNYKVTKVEENEHFPQYGLCIKLLPLIATQLTSALTQRLFQYEALLPSRPNLTETERQNIC